MARAWHVSRIVGVPLPDVEDDEAPVAVRDALPHLLHRHERDAPRGLVEQLRDGLAPGAVGAQRLGQMLGHLEAERAHLGDEGVALAVLKARVLGLLLAERRHLTAL